MIRWELGLWPDPLSLTNHNQNPTYFHINFLHFFFFWFIFLFSYINWSLKIKMNHNRLQYIEDIHEEWMRLCEFKKKKNLIRDFGIIFGMIIISLGVGSDKRKKKLTVLWIFGDDLIYTIYLKESIHILVLNYSEISWFN